MKPKWIRIGRDGGPPFVPSWLAGGRSLVLSAGEPAPIKVWTLKVGGSVTH